MFIVVKNPNEEPKKIEVEEKEDEYSQAWSIQSLIKKLVNDDWLDNAMISHQGHFLVVGDLSIANYPEENFKFTVQKNQFHPDGLASVHGPVIFCRRKFIDDFGLGYLPMNEEEADQIIKSFHKDGTFYSEYFMTALMN